jgi:hypothetical protein
MAQEIQVQLWEGNKAEVGDHIYSSRNTGDLIIKKENLGDEISMGGDVLTLLYIIVEPADELNKVKVHNAGKVAEKQKLQEELDQQEIDQPTK